MPAIDQEQVEEMMTAAVEAMPYRERLAAGLQFRERLSLAEIAFVMDLDLETVTDLLAHSVVRMRSYLGDSGLRPN